MSREAAVIEKACQNIKQVARVPLGARGTNTVARRRMLAKEAHTLLDNCHPTHQKLPDRTKLRLATKERWKKSWTRTNQERRSGLVAQCTEWNPKLRHLHTKLTKPQSTLATLLRIEHIGLEDYLYRRKVPGHPTPACPCGWHRQTPKHILPFCPQYQQGRSEMLQKAGTTDYHSLLSTKKGIILATSWFLQLVLLNQFSLAKEMRQEESQEDSQEDSQMISRNPRDPQNQDNSEDEDLRNEASGGM